MTFTTLPAHTQVLVIGGGPSGSYAASCMAREGLQVTLLEGATFPRYHIGESLLPAVRYHLRFIGAEEKVANFGFVKKPGAAMKLNQHKREGFTDFISLGHENHAWNVTRSEFDNLLLEHAQSCGVNVFQATKVTSIEFTRREGAESSDIGKAVSATWQHTPTSTTGTITFDYVVDASGRTGIISTKYLKNRTFNPNLKNIAMWGYWDNVGTYKEGTAHFGSPWFEALTDESGWAWFIPLANGRTSVGVTMAQAVYNKGLSGSLARYHAALELAPGLKKLIGNGVLIPGGVPPATDRTGTAADEAGVEIKQSGADTTIRVASDYSYSASSYAGENFRIVGDAAAFIDPFFSSGVHLAMTSAVAAAASINASVRGECTEKEAARWHSERVSVSYIRFMLVVLSGYKQMHAQQENVLSGKDEDNFDDAFTLFRPVIQGNADMGPRLSESEVQLALKFCSNLFGPEQLAEMAKEAPANPLDAELAAKDAERRKLLTKMHPHHSTLQGLEDEALAGFALRLERGNLGLVRA